MRAPVSTQELLPSERAFVAAMQQLHFGCYEHLRIRDGEIVLDPWPVGVQNIRFAVDSPARRLPRTGFTLKRQVAELLGYVRTVAAGEIRTLEVRHGLPFSMTVELRPERNGGCHG